MISSRPLRARREGGGVPYRQEAAARPDSDSWLARVRSCLEAARARLLELQRDDGHWCAELEGDSILESEWVMLMHYLGRGEEPKTQKAAAYLREKQLADGGWALYPGGPAELNCSVKAYFVLKLLGQEPDSPEMERARRKIVELGGLEGCNSYTKIYLAIFGQYEWDDAPAVPPEIVLLPRWLPFNLYEMSSWSRAIVVPLSIVWALRPSCPVPEGAMIDELRVSGGRAPRPALGGDRGRLWARFFLLVDALIKVVERVGFTPLRRLALERAERWILERLEESDGLGAIFPPIVNTIYALDKLGYPHDDPLFRSQLDELERLEIEEEETLRVQPCLSPVWDTSQAMSALFEAGLPDDDPRLARAAEWLLDHEVRSAGDWKVKNPGCEPGGWYFEYANEPYPDCDDTAEVLLALSRVSLPGPLADRAGAAIDRGWAWLLSMQNRDGGWASFDRGCDKEWLTYIPFADHNAMIDPSTADITARVLLTMAELGVGRDEPVARRAIDFLLREQEPDGSWYGRWGCNYLYGTWLALTALEAIGEEMSASWARRAAEWVRSCQNEDGGWGELPASYDDAAAKGRGPSNPAQTAWAVMALVAAGGRAKAGGDGGGPHP
ncbi:MAG: squalene--hopene cyclase [Thermoanaerobaculia bacterium]|nr:squalene--hopene cyclase [Thermoanaerobaculia bacterium]